MLPDQFRRLEELFARAIDLPEAELEELLAPLEPALRAALARLLASDASGGDPLAALVGREAAEVIERAESGGSGADPWIGREVGPWRIERRLGAGGMSTVYLARRADGDLPMGVALKLMRPGMSSEDLLARFRTERRILAGLIHPNIARLLDGGSTADGSPYFVMEWVEGEPIDRYADARNLPLAARIDLVRRVAEAVAAAHRRLVVHRDLKPSNILVTVEGAPKLLDFGIAKLLGPDGDPGDPGGAGGEAERTATVLRLFTPSYASPEQLAGEPVTTATDVYSLGVVLSELLSGRWPLRSRGTGSGEREGRRDRGPEPERPSAALLRASAGEAEEIAARRSLKARALTRALAGDLDTIVSTCLRPEPERRYASVDRLAEDLGRFLSGLPIEARRDSLAYRAGKFLRRHRLAAAFAAVFLLATLGFIAALAVQSARLARERDASLAERRRAEAVASFLLDLFRIAQPGAEGGGTVTARELADHGAAEVESRPAAEPRVRATLLETVGRVYLQLGLYDRARKPLEDALALRRRSLPADDPDIADSLNRLAVLSAEGGAYDRAIGLFREALAVRRRRFGSQSPQVAVSLNNLALALQDRGSYAEAAQLYREGLAIDARLLPRGDPELLVSRSNWALLSYDLGDYAVAEAELRSVIALSDWPPGDPELAEQQRYLGLVLTARGDLDGAEALLQPAERLAAAALGEEHPETARATAALAELRLAQRDPVSAAALFQKVFERRSRRLGAGHPETISALAGWARANSAAGDGRAAEERFREALRRGRESLPPQHPDLAVILVGLAELLARQERCGEVPALAREAQSIREAAFRPPDPRISEVGFRTSSCYGPRVEGREPAPH